MRLVEEILHISYIIAKLLVQNTLLLQVLHCAFLKNCSMDDEI